MAEARGAARHVLSPAFAEVVEATEPLFFQPIQDVAVPRMAFGRCCILGDAAFVVRPHPGMGVTKAAEDAAALARALAARPGDVPGALRSFKAERLPVGRALAEHGRRLGAYMQAHRRTPEERAAAERFRTPEAVMRKRRSRRRRWPRRLEGGIGLRAASARGPDRLPVTRFQAAA